jgi:predicted RNA-binding Zn-ribbon protein involved in translation (DUF1610 family)
MANEQKEVEGCWGRPDYDSKCRLCGSVFIECPKEGHVNSHFWELEKPDGQVLKVCPNNCLESDATAAQKIGYDGSVESNIELTATDYQWTCPSCGEFYLHSGEVVVLQCANCKKFFGISAIVPEEK